MRLNLLDCFVAVQRLDRSAPRSAKLPRVILTLWLATLWIAWLGAPSGAAPLLQAVCGTVAIALVLKYALALPLWALSRWYPERVREVFAESGLEWPIRRAPRPK